MNLNRVVNRRSVFTLHRVAKDQCFANSLVECLDADLKPPSAAQLKYATELARNLGVSLPAEAIRFRGEAMDFIARHAEAWRLRTDPKER